MSWNSHMEVHYNNISYPYNTAGSFIEYFEGLTYEHVNFIFSGASHAQDSLYPSTTTGIYKFGQSEHDNTSYCHYSRPYENHHEPHMDEHRRPSESLPTINEQMAAVSTEWGEGVNIKAQDHSIECPWTSSRTIVGINDNNEFVSQDNSIECPRRHQNSHDYQVIWQDNIDPDNMTYEVRGVDFINLRNNCGTILIEYKDVQELLELGEAVGTQSRGLSQEQISSLPTSKYKGWFFLRKKSHGERCVICQMEYKRGDKRITLPCKHAYHASCGTKWLSINKACPVCYMEVFADASKHK